jgi:hypothetical protein
MAGRPKRTYDGPVRRATIAVGAAIGLLGGCSEDSDPKRERAQPAADRCELVTHREEVFVRLTGERARELCGAWSRPGAPGSWTEPSGASENQRSFGRVCVVYHGRTAAGLYAANSIASVAEAKRRCADLIARGWDELGRPDPALAQEYPAPSPRFPVRCAEGRCVQRGERVSRPQSGSDCAGGRWTFALSGNQNFGVYRCSGPGRR